MAAPTVSHAGTGATDAGGAWSYAGTVAGGTGLIHILQIVQDGTTNGAVTFTGNANINDLAGAAGWTQITGPNGDGSWPIGSAESARQFLFIGRTTSGSAPSMSGGNSTSEDLYFRGYAFLNGSTGTTLATVIENGSAGTALNGAGTGTTISDTGVTTLGTDRLALQFVACNDDVAIDSFTGETGGDWTEFIAEYAEPSGTDASLQLQTATMASAGTIDGGSDTIVSAGWGVVGFALIGTTSAVAASMIYQPGLQAAIPRSLYTR